MFILQFGGCKTSFPTPLIERSEWIIKVMEKGEAPINENLRFLMQNMDSLAEKNDRTLCLFFSSLGTRLVS